MELSFVLKSYVSFAPPTRHPMLTPLLNDGYVQSEKNASITSWSWTKHICVKYWESVSKITTMWLVYTREGIPMPRGQPVQIGGTLSFPEHSIGRYVFAFLPGISKSNGGFLLSDTSIWCFSLGYHFLVGLIRSIDFTTKQFGWGFCTLQGKTVKKRRHS